MATLVLVNFLWAAQYPAYKIASQRMSPAPLGFWTLVLAVLLLFPFLWREHRKAPTSKRAQSFGKAVLQYLWLGIFGILPPSVMMAWGIAHSTASNAAILSLTIPVLMTVLGVLMLGERLTLLRVVSLLMALGGTVVVSWSDFSSDLLQSRLFIGNMVIFLAGLGAAFYNVYGKALLTGFSELEVLVYGYIAAAVSCAVISMATDTRSIFQLGGYPLSVWGAILVLGGLSWGIAMVLWMWVLKRMDASQISVSVYLLSVFGVMLSAIALNERPGLAQIIGGLLVLVATYLVSEYEARRIAATNVTARGNTSSIPSPAKEEPSHRV